MNIILCRWICMAVFFCLAQVAVADSHKIGSLSSEGSYSNKQTFSDADLLDEGNETYEDVLATLKSSIDEDLLDEILDEVNVYAHYYSFTPEIDGVVRVYEYSNLTTVPNKLKNVSKSDLKDPLKAIKIIKEALDVIKSGDLYFVMVSNDDDPIICDIRDEMPVYAGNDYDIAVFSFKDRCVGESFSFSLCLEGFSDEPTYKVNLHKNADSSRWQFKYICGTPIRFPSCKSELGWTREGYEFQGWAKNARGDVVYGDGDVVSDIMTEAGLVLNFYAVWDLADMDVFFDANGGYVNEQNRKVKFGKTVGNLPTPILSKHKFLGWYTAVEGGTKVSAKTKVSGNVTYYAQWVYNGLATVSVVMADGCEAMGKVTGGKTAKSGMKLTLKATANKGYVFSHWEGPLDGATDLRSPSIAYVIGEEDAQFTAHFIPVADDAAEISFEMADEYAAGAAIAPVAIDVSRCTSLPKVTVKGLPSGLKFTAKDVFKKGSKIEIEYPANTIYGKPTKSGVYTVVASVTTVGKKIATASQTIIVRKPDEKVVVPVVASEGGEVKGGGVYAIGKKVTLKATAKKGFVFAGWYEDEGFAIPCDSTVTDCRNPSYAYTMGGSDKVFYARFEPAASDTVLDLMVDGLSVPATFTVSEYKQLALEVESLSLPKISVKGLPAGMKFTAKPIYKKGSKTEIEVQANTIYGAPKKLGMYKVSVSISNTSVKKAVVKEFTIEAPDLAAPNNYFVEELDKKYVLSVGISNIDDFLPSLKLNSSEAKLVVSGLPEGLEYDAKAGKITGVATKPGIYTVKLTVTEGTSKYVSTITVEIEALPDWVVGTFEGYDCDNLDKYSDNADAWKKVFAISDNGMMSVKEFGAEGDKIAQCADKYQLTRGDGDMFVMESRRDEGDGEWISLNVTICRHKRNGVDIGIIEGISSGGDDDGYWEGKVFAVQNIWSKDSEFNFLPEISHGTEMFIDMTGWKQWDGDYDGEFPGWYGLYVEGCTLNLKFGKNGAVTATFYEAGATKATGTASATLMPYDRIGNTVNALLTIAIAPKGRHSICIALYLDIDVSRGVVYGDDMAVTNYLMEAD